MSDVESQAFIVQCAIAVPIILGLVIYTVMRRDRSPLHRMMVLLLASIIPWIGGLLFKLVAADSTWRLIGLHAEQLAIFVMPPLFLVTMAHFSRLRSLELGRPLTTVMFTLPFTFAVLYVTDPWHGLFFGNRELALQGVHPEQWGGTLYWASQICAAVLSLSGVAVLAFGVWNGRTSEEKRRALMILAAVAAPIVAHYIYLSGLQPFDYSLSPLTLGLTAILFVYGVEAHGVLEAQPIVRADVLEHLDALVLADKAGTVLDANAAAENVLGSERRGLQGRDLSDVIGLIASADDARALGDHIATLEPGGEHLSGEIHAVDGRVFEVTAASVRAHGTQPAGSFLSLRDRSVQRRNEKLLRERQKLESVGILAAGVAHEVNNPLAYVRANLVHLQNLAGEVLKLDGNDERKRELLDIPDILGESLEGIERISRIVESMLRFSRAPDEVTRSLDLNEVVAEAMRLADLHRDRSVEVASRLDPDLPRVTGSADRLVQVLLNLFLNGKQALKGIPNARMVAETAREDRFVTVRVRDNGPGIDEADRQRIFDPFFTTRGPDEGTGLGLSIAFDIVREHAGRLEVESEPGKGTCFIVRLPLSEAVDDVGTAAADGDAGDRVSD